MEEEKSYGPVIGLIIIILIIALGSVYFLQKREATSPKSTVENITEQSSSDELDDIEADLNSTDFDNLDAELQDIEADLQ